MKKMVLVIAACIGAILFTGCGTKEEKVMTCTRSINQANIKMDLTYTVKYKDKYVTTVQSEEKITTNDHATLESYKKQIENTFSIYKDIEHYKYNVSINGNTLTSTTNIDYEKIDTNKMIEIDSSVQQLIKNGKIAVSDIEATYNQLGITCKK